MTNTAQNTAQDALLQKATSALKQARETILELQQQRREQQADIAIIGMAGRFPGADSIDELWTLLLDEKSGLRTLSEQELAQSGVSKAQYQANEYVPVCGQLNEAAGFDASLFAYAPRDASLLDPQQRVFLETAWQALEDAAYDSKRYQGRVGVYAAGALNAYLSNIKSDASLSQSVEPVQVALGNMLGLMATRTSYHLDLNGPSLGVQASCASSMVALHTAVKALRAQECEMALAGSATVVQGKDPSGYVYQSEGINAKDGVCKPYDADGSGTVFTDGVAVVVLKTLRQAQADGDHIYAVIKGSAINNDGADKVGLTAPSVDGQVKVIEQALRDSGVSADTIDYVEGHGTATILGDPIEVRALNQAYAKAQSEIALGSIKSNLGHLDATAGIAGVIKAALALKHAYIPASLHYQTANPRIPFSEGHFKVQAKGAPWPTKHDTQAKPRRAAVSSFGMGGTNGHMILEQAPVLESKILEQKPVDSESLELESLELEASQNSGLQFLPLSAANSGSLQQMQQNLLTHLQSSKAETQSLADMAFSLQQGRRQLRHRAVFVASDKAQLAQALAQGLDTSVRAEHGIAQYRTAEVYRGEAWSSKPNLVFMFPGQGSQYQGMAESLYADNTVFKAAIDACFTCIDSDVNLEILQQAMWKLGRQDADCDPLAVHQTALTQPALFCVEYALAQVALQQGLVPQVLIGHSIGEYVAATLAGVFSLADAIKLVQARGRLMQACPSGAMLSVFMSHEQLAPYLNQDIELAVINGPLNCVLGGTMDKLHQLAEKLDKRGVGVRLVRTSHAFHTSMMDSALAEFADVLASVTLQPPQIEMISNVTGEYLSDEQATSVDYWVSQLRHTVQFAKGLTEVLALPNAVLLELGPGASLGRFAAQQFNQSVVDGRESQQGLCVVDCLADAKTAAQQQSADLAQCSIQNSHKLAKAFAQLWLAGVELDWSALSTSFNFELGNQRVSLPAYAFARETYWIEGQSAQLAGSSQLSKLANTSNAIEVAQTQNDSGRQAMQDWLYQPVWQRLRLSRHHLNEPCLVLAHDQAQFDAFVSAMISASEQTLPQSAFIPAIAMTQVAQYQSILAQIEPQDWPSKVVNLLGVCSAGDTFEAGSDSHAEVNSPALKATLAFIQALDSFGSLKSIANESKPKLEINIVSVAGLSVNSLERLNPAQAALQGLVRVINAEAEHACARLIDLAEADLSTTQVLLKNALASPIDYQQPILALRGSWAYKQNHCVLNAPSNLNTKEQKLQHGGCYVIAGCLDQTLGQLYAQYLRKHYQAKLILLGESGLQQRGTSWLKGLGEAGEDYVVFEQDLANNEQINEQIAQALAQLAVQDLRVDGAFFCSAMGEEASELLASVDCENALSSTPLLRNKTAGLANLSQGLMLHQPGFLLIQSSLSSLLGGISLGAYSAANTYIDALSETLIEQLSDTQVQVINWDVVATEQLASPVATSSAIQGQLAQAFEQAISPDEAWACTLQVLNALDVNHIVISPFDLQQRKARSIAAAHLGCNVDGSLKSSQGEQPLENLESVESLESIDIDAAAQALSGASSQGAAGVYQRPALDVEYQAPSDDIERAVAQAMADLLGIDKVGMQDNFFELGGHSLLAVQAITRLRKTYGVDIPMRALLFEAPTASGVAGLIKQALQDLDAANQAELPTPANDALVDADHDLLEALLDDVEQL